jgi:uncharacterized protein (DUF1499 family)
MGLTLAFGIIVLLGLLAYIRLAPSDPAVWHIDMAAPGFQPPPNWAEFCPHPDSQYAPAIVDPAATLAELDAIALQWPGTTRLAGNPSEGRITWITRSRLIGFPDYSTAQILTDPAGPRLCILARQRFGTGDGGVNARRILSWAQSLLGLAERPDQAPF